MGTNLLSDGDLFENLRIKLRAECPNLWGLSTSSHVTLHVKSKAQKVNCCCGDWVLHALLPLTSCDFCSQILSIYERSIEVFFSFFLVVFTSESGIVLTNIEKCPFLVFFGATDGNFMEKYNVTPS